MDAAPATPSFSPHFPSLPPRQAIGTADPPADAVPQPSRFHSPPRMDPRAHRNGYEIRTEMLALASDWLQFHYAAQVQESERQRHQDGILAAPPRPEPPSAEEVLATARKFYNFVTEHNKR